MTLLSRSCGTAHTVLIVVMFLFDFYIAFLWPMCTSSVLVKRIILFMETRREKMMSAAGTCLKESLWNRFRGDETGPEWSTYQQRCENSSRNSETSLPTVTSRTLTKKRASRFFRTTWASWKKLFRWIFPLFSASMFYISLLTVYSFPRHSFWKEAISRGIVILHSAAGLPVSCLLTLRTFVTQKCNVHQDTNEALWKSALMTDLSKFKLSYRRVPK